MNAITISYRFSREELCALLQGLRINGLPGAPLTPVDSQVAAKALERLGAEGLVMVADDTLYVDRLIACLLNAAAEARAGVAVTDGSRTAVLWRAEQMLLLGDFPEQGDCALTPLQNEEEALSALADALCRMARPLWAMNLFDQQRRMSVPDDTAQDEASIASDALALLGP